MVLEDKRVLVIGFGKTGVSLVEFLHNKGARIVINDARESKALAGLMDKIAKFPVKTVLGGHPVDDRMYENPELVILSPGIPLDLPLVRSYSDRGIPVMGEIELAFQFMQAPVVAITGTNGKTTTTALTGEMFGLSGGPVEVVGNIGIPAISKAESLNDCGHFIMEISSFQLETIHTFRPIAAALLNITPDHLNRHGTLEEYAALKYRVFQNQRPGDVAVINADDEGCRQFKKNLPSRLLSFSRKRTLDEGVFIDGEKVMVRWNDSETYLVSIGEIRIPGPHNLENAMAASALAISCGVTADAIREALRSFPGVEHRIETVAVRDGVTFINDSKATNPDAAIKAIEAVPSPVILLAGGLDKKNDFTALIQSFSNRVKQMIVYGETADQLKVTAVKNQFSHVERTSDLEMAFRIAVKNALPGDTVLLSPACASWDMYENYEKRGKHFKELVKGLDRNEPQK